MNFNYHGAHQNFPTVPSDRSKRLSLWQAFFIGLTDILQESVSRELKVHLDGKKMSPSKIGHLRIHTYTLLRQLPRARAYTYTQFRDFLSYKGSIPSTRSTAALLQASPTNKPRHTTHSVYPNSPTDRLQLTAHACAWPFCSCEMRSAG